MIVNKYNSVVEDYLKVLTLDDIRMINRWTSHADVPIDVLIKFYLKIRNIEPVSNLQIYRGIGTNLSYQEKMNLFEKKFLMHFLMKGVQKGYNFTYSTPRPLSFSDDIKTARAFGNVVVSTTLNRAMKYIRITQAFWDAANQIDASSLFQEVILLEINKDVRYTVLET